MEQIPAISTSAFDADAPTSAAVEVAAAFEVLFALERQPMLRLALRLVDIPERAEEIVQDAFEKTLLAWPKLREPGAYLRTAVVNGCRSELRRRAVMRRHPWPAAATAELDPTDAALVAAVARLTPKRRIAVTLRYWADLSEADIAVVMGVRVGTVKSLLSRALADLRRADLRETP
jgi:RNA polymerase sigma factor (sigma-70 family)